VTKIEVCKVLLAAGADPNVKNEYGGTPLRELEKFIWRLEKDGVLASADLFTIKLLLLEKGGNEN
jgi:hypothetical protein